MRILAPESRSTPPFGECRGSRDAGPKTASTPAAIPLAPVTRLDDARRRRAEALRGDDEEPDQNLEARLWGDRRQGDAA